MEAIGAPGVGIAVFLENIFPPIPSEVVLPLAGFTASKGSISLLGAFLWATAGSVIGAYVLYWLGAAIGAKRLRAIAEKMPLVDGKDVDKALLWFDKWGKWSVFFGRLIPGVRSLISIPAGIDRMNPIFFGLLTLIGSAIWNAILIYLGWMLGDQWENVTHVLEQFSSIIKYILVAILAGVVVYLAVRANKRKKLNS